VNRRDAAMQDVLVTRGSELGQLAGRLAALSPLAVLERGYAVVRQPDGTRTALRSATQLAPQMKVELQMHGGTAIARIETVQLDPSTSTAPSSSSSATGSGPGAEASSSTKSAKKSKKAAESSHD
jgi:Exonuclease VII, large subunit